METRPEPTAVFAQDERILIVDDEDAVRLALSKLLRSSGYDVDVAASGPEAIAMLSAGSFDLMLVDVFMPGMNGVELARRSIREFPEVAVIMLTAADDATTAKHALTAGALDYLVKPVDARDLCAAVREALHRRTLVLEQRRVERLIREEVEQEHKAVEELTVGVVDTLVNAMEAKDEFLHGQSHRTAELAASIASEMGLSDTTVEQIRLAGRLHDVGRIGVRESVLNKRGTLTDDDLEHLRSHLRIGVEILSPLRRLGPVLTFVQDHHEHWDGGGYPRALRGADISIGGRVLAAADAFQALTSKRAYRDALEPARAVEYMESLSGTLLDPDVYSALCRVVARRAHLPFIGVQT